MIRLAFYGKGGIGKSTIAANFSALLAKKGKRVLHIGCDPKADATRLLTERKIPTVLQQLETKDHLKREDMVFPGIYGIQCVEAGGPDAGCGCAGLGITTAVEELKSSGVFRENWDVIIYDVLGDVVCGGFSVPMRKKFVDSVYVVTSADYMALYAANNILRGVKRYSVGVSLFGGLICNHVREERDLEILQRFAEKTNTDIFTWLYEENAVKKADFQRKILAVSAPGDKNVLQMKDAVKKLIDSISKKEKSDHTLMEGQRQPACCPLCPMDGEEMEKFGKEMAEIIYGSENYN